MEKNSVKVVMVDDEISFLEGLGFYFLNSADIELIGTARSGDECLRSLDNWPEAEVILMDIKMETPKAGLQAAQQIKVYPEHPRNIIFLTSEYNSEDVIKALQMKCSFVDKSCSPGRLIKIILDVCHQHRQIIDIPLL